MAEQSLWRRFLSAVERTYERRIRAASLVHEYGAAHGGHHAEADGAEAAVIANVPRGTRLGARAPHVPSPPVIVEGDANHDRPSEQ